MKTYDDIFRQIAKEEKTTVEQVYKDMQEAIDAGFDNPDPEVRAVWKDIPFKGARPTPEDVISYCALRLAPPQGLAQ